MGLCPFLGFHKLSFEISQSPTQNGTGTCAVLRTIVRGSSKQKMLKVSKFLINPTILAQNEGQTSLILQPFEDRSLRKARSARSQRRGRRKTKHEKRYTPA